MTYRRSNPFIADIRWNRLNVLITVSGINAKVEPFDDVFGPIIRYNGEEVFTAQPGFFIGGGEIRDYRATIAWLKTITRQPLAVIQGGRRYSVPKLKRAKPRLMLITDTIAHQIELEEDKIVIEAISNDDKTVAKAFQTRNMGLKVWEVELNGNHYDYCHTEAEAYATLNEIMQRANRKK